MKRTVLAVLLLFLTAGLANARGLVIPVEKSLPPLAMLNHKVSVGIEDQVAVTKVEQVFRNHTSRELEATYVFPVPRGASVREFAMWVNGKRMTGELLPADKAKKVYTDIVRQSHDPGLLEYIGHDLLSLRIFPVPPKADTKVEVSFTSIARKDHEIVEYTYPLKTDGKATSTLEDFSMSLTLKSQEPISNIYSPTHAVTIHRKTDREAQVVFEKNQALLDKDFQIFYMTTGKDVGLTALQHRPISTEDGYFMLLISPRIELSESQVVPRDIIFVLDTSGSMLQDDKITQAKKAVKHCLQGLSEKDRFGLINFATTVNRYRDGLIEVNKEQIDAAKKWVDKLEATGGTAINEALASALDLRTKDEARTFTVVFFTDGKPTIGETNPDKILANVSKKNTANTRIFTFGVGHDVNAAMLDQIADHSRAVSSYVRPEEDIEVKVSSFFGKINRPVLANLKIASGETMRMAEVYPPQLPDLFHGDQLVVLGRYQGSGKTKLTLTGSVGMETREYVYEVDFATKTEDKPFVEDVWARRKVGYLLEQIRINGEKKELVDEVTKLAKKYGITTPYTSFLIVPDAAMPVAQNGVAVPGFTAAPGGAPAALAPADPNGKKLKVAEFAKNAQKEEGELARNRGLYQDGYFARLPAQAEGRAGEVVKALREGGNQKGAFDQSQANIRGGQAGRNNVDKLGVDLSCCVNSLKCQTRLQQTAYRNVANRGCMEIGGVWIDEEFTAKTPILAVKAQSDAYFRMLERQPQVKDVFRLGNHLVWMCPNGTALVIDTDDGKDKLTDAEIDALFVAMK